MATKPVAALVLCDEPAHGLKAGQLLEADAALVKALAAGGSVDAHKDAVAYARANGAATVRSAIELAGEARAAAVETLRADIAALETRLAAAAEEAEKNALSADVTARRAQLAQLLA